MNEACQLKKISELQQRVFILYPALRLAAEKNMIVRVNNREDYPRNRLVREPPALRC